MRESILLSGPFFCLGQRDARLRLQIIHKRRAQAHRASTLVPMVRNQNGVDYCRNKCSYRRIIQTPTLCRSSASEYSPHLRFYSQLRTRKRHRSQDSRFKASLGTSSGREGRLILRMYRVTDYSDSLPKFATLSQMDHPPSGCSFSVNVTQQTNTDAIVIFGTDRLGIPMQPGIKLGPLLSMKSQHLPKIL